MRMKSVFLEPPPEPFPADLPMIAPAALAPPSARGWPAVVDTAPQTNALANAIEGDLDDAAAALERLASDGWALVCVKPEEAP